MLMSDSEIYRKYKNNPSSNMLKILADLNACSTEVISNIVFKEGQKQTERDSEIKKNDKRRKSKYSDECIDKMRKFILEGKPYREVYEELGLDKNDNKAYQRYIYEKRRMQDNGELSEPVELIKQKKPRGRKKANPPIEERAKAPKVISEDDTVKEVKKEEDTSSCALETFQNLSNVISTITKQYQQSKIEEELAKKDYMNTKKNSESLYKKKKIVVDVCSALESSPDLANSEDVRKFINLLLKE